MTTERLKFLARLVPTKSKLLLILSEARQSRLEGWRLMMTTPSASPWPALSATLATSF